MAHIEIEAERARRGRSLLLRTDCWFASKGLHVAASHGVGLVRFSVNFTHELLCIARGLLLGLIQSTSCIQIYVRHCIRHLV